jgi:hypothetical protein
MKMKVVVRYFGIVETAVEVDDKFNHLRGFNFNATEEQENLMDELLETLLHTIPASIDEFYNISAEDGEILTEI